MYSGGRHSVTSWENISHSQQIHGRKDSANSASQPLGQPASNLATSYEQQPFLIAYGQQQSSWNNVGGSAVTRGSAGNNSAPGGVGRGDFVRGAQGSDRGKTHLHAACGSNTKISDFFAPNPNWNAGWNGPDSSAGPSAQGGQRRQQQEAAKNCGFIRPSGQGDGTIAGCFSAPSQKQVQQPQPHHLNQHQQQVATAPLASIGRQRGHGQGLAQTLNHDGYHVGEERFPIGSLEDQGGQATQPQYAPEQHQNQHQHQQHRSHHQQDVDTDQLVAVRDLPEPFQRLFPNFRYFNPVQSECFQEAYGSDVNMVVSAPTGSGKTGVMELALLRLLSQHLSPPGAPGSGSGGGNGCGSGVAGTSVAGSSLRPLRGTNKAVYVAPLRALVQEKCKDWQARFGGLLGLSVLELSGDSEPEAAELEAADVLCTTPEKLDALSRKLSEQNRSATFLSDIRLVLIDEVHLLNEAERGSALEAGVVSRLTLVSAFPELSKYAISRLRFVAVSATIPNVQDIATWLRVPLQGLKVYGEEMRPVRLRTLVRTYAPAKNDFLFERRLDSFLPGVLAENSSGKPSLVFCSSRKGTVDSATYLASRATGAAAGGGSGGGTVHTYVRDAGHAERLAAAAREVAANKQLQTCLLAGVGFHNAAIEAHQREVVERLFLAGDLPVLCSTSTLALGVNLPAHLVVIRGTRRYCGADGSGGPGDDGGSTTGYKEYDRSVCLQMVGRAGRPQFDTEGVAVIMTQKETYARYANLLSGSEPVESCLHDCFAEHLNAEVVLATVRDLETATKWLRTTFLYVRVRQSPRTYGLDPPSAAMASDASFDRWLTERLVGQAVARLAEVGLVAQDPSTGALRALEPGRIMAHSYLRLETMKAITQVGLRAGMVALLRVVAVADEFSHIRLRRGEKRVLNDINKRVSGEGAIKYPVPADGPAGAAGGARAPKPKDRITKPTEKIFIMVNEALSDASAEVLDYSMRQELEGVLRVGQRIAGAMGRYFDFRQAFAATANSLCLSKALRQRMWEDSGQSVRQLPDIGRLLAQRLAAAGLGGLRQLAAADPRRIEAVTQKAYPFGNTVRSHIAKKLPPEVQLRMRPLSAFPNQAQVTVEIELTRLDAAEGPHTSTSRTPAHLLVGLSNSDQLLRHERLTVETFQSPYRFRVAAAPPPHAPRGEPLHVLACLILERMCGLDVNSSLRVVVNHGSVVVVDSADGAAAAPAGVDEMAAWAAAGGAGPAARAPDVNDAALQPSPFPARAPGLQAADSGDADEAGADGVDHVVRAGAPGRSANAGAFRGASSASQQAHQHVNHALHRAKRDRGPGTDVAAARPATRPQVMMEAPALAAPAFALEAASPSAAPVLHQWQNQTSPPQPGSIQQPVQRKGPQQACQQPASSSPSQPLSAAQSDSLAVRSASGAGKGVSKRSTGAGGRGAAGGGGKKGQGLIMSGVSLAGAKQAPAFAKLLALGGKPAPAQPGGGPTAVQVAATPAADNEEYWNLPGPCMADCSSHGGGDDGSGGWCSFTEDKRELVDGGLGSALDEPIITHGSRQHGGGISNAGPPSRSEIDAQADEEPLGDLFDFLVADADEGRGKDMGRGAGGQGWGKCDSKTAAGPRSGNSIRHTAQQPSVSQAETARMPPPALPPLAPAPPAAVSPGADASQRKALAPPALSPQVLQQLQRPGMVMTASSASMGLAAASMPARAATTSQPASTRPTTGFLLPFNSTDVGRKDSQRPQPSGSQAALLSERKKRMLAGNRDRGTAAGLQLMQKRQARNMEAAAGVAPAASRYTSGEVWACSGGAASGGGNPGARGPQEGLQSSPASSSVSAMQRAGPSAVGTGNFRSMTLPAGLEEGDGEYDSAAVKDPDVLLDADNWAESDSDGGSDDSGRQGMFNLLPRQERDSSKPLCGQAVEQQRQQQKLREQYSGFSTGAQARCSAQAPDGMQQSPSQRPFVQPPVTIAAAAATCHADALFFWTTGGGPPAAAQVAPMGGGSGGGRSATGTGWSEFVDESDAGGLPLRLAQQPQPQEQPPHTVQKVSAWRANKALRTSHASSAATAARQGSGAVVNEASLSGQLSNPATAIAAVRHAPKQSGPVGPPTSTTGVLVAAEKETASRATAAGSGREEGGDPWRAGGYADTAAIHVPPVVPWQDAVKAPMSMPLGPGGEVDASVAPSAPAIGTRPGSNRYSVLADLTQGLGKRKAAALFYGSCSQQPVSSERASREDPRAGWDTQKPPSPPQQRALQQPQRLSEPAAKAQQQQPSHEQVLDSSTGPLRRTGEGEERAPLGKRKTGLEAAAAGTPPIIVGWRPSYAPGACHVPLQPQLLGPRQQTHGEQHRGQPQPLEPIVGDAGASASQAVDDNIDPTQEWLSSLLF